MNNQFTGMNLITKLIIGLMALMMIVGLAIPVAVEYTYGSYPFYKDDTTTFNGFNTLMGDSYLMEYASAVAAVNWVLLIAGILCFILAIIAIFSTSNKQSRTLKNIVAIVAFISAFLYMIEGITMVILWVGGDSTTTISPVLFSIQLVLMIVYFTCSVAGKNSNNTQNNVSYNQPQYKDSPFSSQQANSANNISTNKSDNYGELIKYKELLEIGAITKEEFEAKKKELL